LPHLVPSQGSISLRKASDHVRKHGPYRHGPAAVKAVVELLESGEIAVLSRILAVAGFTDRHRRRGETDAQIAAALRECAGHAFDPQCVEVMCGMLTEKT